MRSPGRRAVDLRCDLFLMAMEVRRAFDRCLNSSWIAVSTHRCMPRRVGFLALDHGVDSTGNWSLLIIALHMWAASIF